MQYISKQFNGARVQSIPRCTEQTLDSLSTPLNYLSTLSIDTANEQHLEFIGKLVGLNRPIVSADVFNESLYRFSAAKQVSNVNGFSSLSKTIGTFGSLVSTASEIKLPLQAYKDCLKALVKTYEDGSSTVVTSLSYLYNLIAAFSNQFTVTFITYNDINIQVGDLGSVDLALLDILIQAIFNTAPRITLLTGRRA